MTRYALGAYQFLEVEQADLGPQYTEGGEEPQTLIIQLTTPMDEEFVNKTVTALMTEAAQRKVITVFRANLTGHPLPGDSDPLPDREALIGLVANELSANGVTIQSRLPIGSAALKKWRRRIAEKILVAAGIVP